MSSPSTSPVPAMPSRTVWLLSASGLIPLLVCLAIAYGAPARRAQAVQVYLTYSALTLAFLGGARWGAELVRAPQAPMVLRLLLGAMPSVVGLAALLPALDPRVATGLLLGSSALQLRWDLRGARTGALPAWNGRVRAVLTAAGTACTIAMLPAILAVSR